MDEIKTSPPSPNRVNKLTPLLSRTSWPKFIWCRCIICAIVCTPEMVRTTNIKKRILKELSKILPFSYKSAVVPEVFIRRVYTTKNAPKLCGTLVDKSVSREQTILVVCQIIAVNDFCTLIIAGYDIFQ